MDIAIQRGIPTTRAPRRTRLHLARQPCSLLRQVNRPLSMKKEGIQTRKRKPKNHSAMTGNLAAGPSSMHKTEIKSGLLGESSVSKLVIQFLCRPHSFRPPALCFERGCVFVDPTRSPMHGRWTLRRLPFTTLASFTFTPPQPLLCTCC